MARKVTARDRTVRVRWASFLTPIVGANPGVPVAELAKAISANTARSGDAGWQVRDWIDGDRTVSPGLAFAAGEALRGCGIGWSTGLGALWAAGYFGEYALTLANLAQDYGVLDMTPRTPVLIVPDYVVLLGTIVPLCASPGLALQLHADAERLDKARHSIAAFAQLPVGPRKEAAWPKSRRALPGDGLLAHAANLGDVQNVEIEIRERLVWMLVAEWAINAASAQLREGRLAEIAGLWVSLGRLMESAAARDAAVARAADPLLAAVDSIPAHYNPRTSASRTGRKKA